MGRFISNRAIAVILLVAACTSSPTGGGPAPLFGGRIAFRGSPIGGADGLYILDGTGTVTRMAPAVLSSVGVINAVATNGSLVAYSSLDGIILVDPRDGGMVLDTIPLVCCGSPHLAISPDGEQVAWWDGWNRQLKSIRRDGTLPRILEARPEVRSPIFAHLVWAGPDRVLAMEWGLSAQGGPSGTSDVLEYNLAVGGSRRALESLRDVPTHESPVDLSASADGAVLVWSIQDLSRPAKVRIGDAEGRVLRTIELQDPHIGIGIGRVSPDGRHAVFAMDLDQPCHTCVAIVNLQTGATTLIDTGLRSAYPRAWMPD